MTALITNQTKILKFFLITFLLLSIACFSAFFFKFYFIKKNISPTLPKIQLEALDSLPQTKLTNSKICGAALITNLYFTDSSFQIFTDPTAQFSIKSLIDPQSNYKYRIKHASDSLLNVLNKPVARFHGTTLVLNASDEMKSMQGHYFHFCEEFLIALNIYQQSGINPIKTVIFPSSNDWKGRVNEINLKLLQACLPDAVCLGADEFYELQKRHPIKFDEVIFVDRSGMHQEEIVRHFNKMMIPFSNSFNKNVISDFKEKVWQKLHTKENLHSKPYITYIKRKSYRYLDEECEKKLLAQIEEKFPQYQLRTVWLENYSFSEQIQIIRNTKVLIGAHGNGLTHQLFMPSNSLVIEIFPTGAYNMDYQLMAEFCEHSYFGIDPENGVIATIGKRMPFKGNVNQIIKPIDTNLVSNLIDSFDKKNEL